MQERGKKPALLIERVLRRMPPFCVPGFVREVLSRTVPSFWRIFRRDDAGVEDRVRGLLFAPLFKTSELRIGRSVCFEGRRNIELGDGVALYGPLHISATGKHGGVQVGSRTHVDRFAALYGQGGLRIGNGCAIASGVMIYSQSNQYDARPGVAIIEQGTRYASVEIGDDVWIGAGAVILPGVRIADHAVVGAGSVVTKDVEPATIVVGSPARPIKKREGFA